MTTRKTMVSLAALAFIACYGTVLVDLALAWVSSPVYSYGLAVLAVALYMVWTKSNQMRSLPAVPDYLLGVSIVIAGIAMLVVGHIALVTTLQQASLVITVAGFVLVLFGRATLGHVWFPLAYMLLGFPIWSTVISRMQPPSQWLSGSIAAGLLRTIGTPVLHEGNTLALPNVTLEVMRECSGVNQLLAVLAMVLPAGFIYLSGFVRRVTLLGLAIISAYVSNGARIALVGYMAVRGLSDGDLRGLHLFQGLLVSAFCYLIIFACLSRLARWQPPGKPAESPSDAGSPTSIVRRPWLEVATSLAAIVVGIALPFYHTQDVRLGGDLHAFPVRIGEWSLDSRPTPSRFPAIDDELVQAYPTPEGERRFLAIDDELVRSYRDASGQQVRLYIGYHRSQSEGKELAGEAGHLLDAASTPIRLQLGSASIELAEIVRNGSGGTRGVLYWYDLNGRVLSNIYRAKPYMVWDALTRRRSNGAVVMVEWESVDTGDVGASRMKAAAFARTILPLLPEFIPS